MALKKDDLHSRKDDLLKHISKALADAGLHDFDVQSIHLNLKHVRRCPDGQEPVWGPVTKPDGTVVFEWTCP